MNIHSIPTRLILMATLTGAWACSSSNDDDDGTDGFPGSAGTSASTGGTSGGGSPGGTGGTSSGGASSMGGAAGATCGATADLNSMCVALGQSQGQDCSAGTACACACANCPCQLLDCDETPGCTEIRLCAQEKGCTGVDCLAPETCQDVIAMFPETTHPGAVTTAAQVSDCFDMAMCTF